MARASGTERLDARASGTLRTDGALRGESGGARAEAPGLTLTSGPLSTFEDGGEEGWVRS